MGYIPPVPMSGGTGWTPPTNKTSAYVGVPAGYMAATGYIAPGQGTQSLAPYVPGGRPHTVGSKGAYTYTSPAYTYNDLNKN